ncbi:armadillo-like helical domain-containing protein 3 [Neocloeon triangulifer]|uniref:armadillo-like helical domain-containing protein 3 n=1 Tax=Neocloeon triangulifer TaxID=2078957 RepID=UPI00286EDA8C|nr:armadillo-like helical domain-containing protein 3 [Neocloeon triangulifer]
MSNSRKWGNVSSKKPSKGKVVQIYESFLKGEDPSVGNEHFWHEFFLLKPCVSKLESELAKLTGEQLTQLREQLNLICTQCIDILQDDSQIRIAVALQTLCTILKAITRKAASESNLDVVNTFVGHELSKNYIPLLFEHCSSILSSNPNAEIKGSALRLLLALATGSENLSQNTILEYSMNYTSQVLFEALVHILQDPDTRLALGQFAIQLLTLFVNFSKYEGTNPFVVQLSILDNELALNGYSQVITSHLADFCWQYTTQNAESHAGGWFSSLTNMVGSMFVSDEGSCRNQQIRNHNAVLLALYEAVHLNRNFITNLVQTQADTSSPPSPTATLDNIRASAEGNQPGQQIHLMANPASQPTSLLATFIEYCSIVTQDTKPDTLFNNGKLCLLILTCISEDQYANSLMHDPNLVYKVQLHRSPMRHRKIPSDLTLPAQPLACAMLDFVVEFITSHKMKRFPMELYLLSIGIAQRLVCYQKRCRVRLTYQWPELWKSLIALLRFLLSHEGTLAKKMNIFQLALQVVNIFNLFITYGDTFLPSPTSYDELYYEMIRMHQVFNNLHAMALRYSSIEGEYKEWAQKLANSLVNVRAITSHFVPKINTWLTEQGLSTPSEDQILEVVRSNYDSLMLKLQDNLDHYERYSESPQHESFFYSMVQSVINDINQNIDFTPEESVQKIFQEFASAT